MDMNDILAQWDKMQADQIKKQKESGKNTVSHKKANAPTPEEKARAAEKDFEAKLKAENSKEINPMEMWLRRYGTVDKDKIAVNPLNDDNDFKQIKKNNLSYVVATNGASKRNLSASYFNIDENKYYSITNYQYDNGDFHFNNITSNNMTSYSLEENPIIYHLFLL